MWLLLLYGVNPINANFATIQRVLKDLSINSLKKERDRIHSLEIKEQENDKT